MVFFPSMKACCHIDKLLLILWVGLIGCHGDDTRSTTEEYLFEVLPDSLTNVRFVNEIRESSTMNGFVYEYLYNGAGVAVGDLNNDELLDIYFVANLTDNRLYINRGGLSFEDATIKAGIKGKYGFHTGVTLVDINADGKLDIYLSKSGKFNDPDKRRNELYINQGNDEKGVPWFIEEAEKYNLDLPHFSTQAAFFDYDQDEDLDMFLVNHNIDPDLVQSNMEQLRYAKNELASDRLFQNNNGRFIDVSDKSGIINDGIGFGLGLGIGDFNNDGWPDILVGHDYTSKDRIYLNQQDGTFQESINQVTGHISNFSMGNEIADFNNDGWLDFMTVDMVSEDNYGIKASMSGMNPDQFNFLVREGFHHQYMFNTAQINNGNRPSGPIPVFSDIAAMAGVSNTDWSWGPLFFDMDNDGDKDLFVSNGIKRDFRNVDYLIFKNKKQQELKKNLAKVPDNLKGMLQEKFVAEMLKNMPGRKKDNYFYENSGDLNFIKKNKSWVKEAITASNGAAYGDLDNDGDLDIVTNNMDGGALIYKNNTSEKKPGNYLKVRLHGTPKNPDGIGSRVTIKTRNGIQMLEQYFSRGFQSSKGRGLHFGLGQENLVEWLEVAWPGGFVQRLEDVGANQTLILNHSHAGVMGSQYAQDQPVFTDITQNVALNHQARENEFDDFGRESLLPHKMSQEGPALAVGDVNEDGLDDFYVGASVGFSGRMYLQQPDGGFRYYFSDDFVQDAPHEDVAAVFFDADGDQDLDLYVVSGGNEHEAGSSYYEDRLYINHNGKFGRVKGFVDSGFAFSGSVVKPCDFDQDGDFDLFVGGRQSPGKYPFPGYSYLLKNESKGSVIGFKKVEGPWGEIGMVTDATWTDIDGDNDQDLIVVGEWMSVKVYINKEGGFEEQNTTGLNQHIGWWFSITATDYDNDGDMDLVAGNLGLNSKYKSTPDEPFQVFANDFDESGSLDIVLGYYQNGQLFPLRGRQCSSSQMPFIKDKFPSYHAFASAGLEAVYGMKNMEESLHFGATNFASVLIENKGDGAYLVKELPILGQTSTVREIAARDVNKDGFMDLLLFGNMHGFEVETPRQDAGLGVVMINDRRGGFEAQMPFENGLYVKGEVSAVGTIRIPGGEEALLIAKNNDKIQLIKLN
ncbi:MAG: VCBS repeat-containing protein [Cyclobacteriaceae bacterium]